MIKELTAAALARSTSAPSNPTGTTSTTGVMMGLAGTVTPLASGKCVITITGDITNGTLGDGGKAQIRYGTGTAPANAAALTGTAAGSLEAFVAATATNKAPFSLEAYVTGLTPGTAYWIDASLAAITGGTATIADLTIIAEEVA